VFRHFPALHWNRIASRIRMAPFLFAAVERKIPKPYRQPDSGRMKVPADSDFYGAGCV
jgi:hypothetical protein